MTQANILAQIGSQSGPTFRNRIINGAMQVTQYGGGATNNGSGATATYSVDRWALYGSSSSKFTGQQSSGTSLAGFNKWLYLVSSAATSLGASDYYTVYQSIEGLNVADLGWGTANAKTITLSFWVIGSVAGTYGGSLSNGANNRSYPFTYPVTTSWSQVSVTIAGDTTGTWNTDNTRGITLTYGLGVGTTYSGTAGSWAGTLYLSATGATNFVGTSGANLSITGVQLEVGSSATGFEYRQYQQELALCQRYYEKSNGVVASGYSDGVGLLYCCVFNWFYKSEKRASPTVNRITNASSVLNVNQPAYTGGGTNSCEIVATSTATGRTYFVDAIFEAVAEL